jgi:NAD(P)-dependent dehydrogenase (short-subunit alcohol dehydrogenase family)
MGELDGKVAVITGAGSGMAKAAVKIFVREGAAGVIAADISGAEEETAKEIGGAVVPVHCDVTQDGDVFGAIDAAVQRFGRVDAVLNIAGIGIGGLMTDITLEQYDKLMDVLLKGVFLGTTHAIRAFQKAGTGGAIVNWSSVGGLNAAPYTGVYSAAKAGAIGITKAAAVDHGHENIRTNAICPGYVLSEGMGQGLVDRVDVLEPKIPMHRLGQPAEVSELAAFLCSDRASYVNGAIIPVDGGYSVRFA